MKNFQKFLITTLIIITIVALFKVVAYYNFIDEEGAKKALIEAGYHPISTGGYDLFNCGGGDLWKTKFKAYSPDSSRVLTGCVCEGIFKGKTIRLD